MFGFKKRAAVNPPVDDIVAKRIHKFQLKDRVRKAVEDSTPYEKILRDYLGKNSKNLFLITKVAGHLSYLVERCGVEPRAAAKECLELFVWNR